MALLREGDISAGVRPSRRPGRPDLLHLQTNLRLSSEEDPQEDGRRRQIVDFTAARRQRRRVVE